MTSDVSQLTFFGGATLSDIANVVIAIMATAGFCLARSQLRQQTHIRDAAAVIELQRDLGRLWENYLSAGPETRNFHFGQLVSAYEAACYMFNRELLSQRVRGLFAHHIIEVFIRFMRDQDTMALLRQFQSGESTYHELITFFRRNRDQYQKHWTFLQSSGLA